MHAKDRDIQAKFRQNNLRGEAHPPMTLVGEKDSQLLDNRRS